MEERKKALSTRQDFRNALLQQAQSKEKMRQDKPFQSLSESKDSNGSILTDQTKIKSDILDDMERNNKDSISTLYCDEVLLPSEEEYVSDLHRQSPVDPYANSDDHSNDADYVPDLEDSDDSEVTICSSPAKKIVLLGNISSDKNVNPHCDYEDCKKEIFSTCGHCLCFLCWEHFDDDVAYTDCKRHNVFTSKKQSNLSNKENILPFTITGHNRSQQKKFHIISNIIVKKANAANTINNKVEAQKTFTKEKQQSFFSESRSQHCEYRDCKNTVFTTCDDCSCLLCLNHFDSIKTENKCDEHIPPATCIINNDNRKQRKNKKNINKLAKTSKVCEKSDSVSTSNKSIDNVSKHEQHCEFIDCKQKVFTTCDTCFCLLCFDHFPNLKSDSKCSQHKPNSTDLVAEGPALTKDGNLRKRKLYEENLETRIKKREKLNDEKFDLKPPCSCNKNCSEKFDEDFRKNIHSTFRILNWESQGLFIKGLVDVLQVERRKTTTKNILKRKVTHAYHLISEDDQRIEVCKYFFLTSLGFNPKNDRRVLQAVRKPIDQQKILRGKYIRENKIDKEIIKQHILKYQPSISHYRREHAPNRLYLPSDINIASMYTDFCNEYPNIQISSEHYRKIVRVDLNISFANLGHEECEQCAYFHQHNKNHVLNPDKECEVCHTYQIHHDRYKSARADYQRDVERSKKSNDEVVYCSVDLQKVIMLPRIDQFKAAIFCPRVIVFNETFVPLGTTSGKNVPFATVWPETTAGRNQEDIISTFRAFFIHNRDAKDFVLWADNCSSQNKNWAFFSFLVNIINSNLISAETITIKYFEPGHSFMSADSFHHQVELSLKRKKKVYDFDDFVSAVQQSNSKKNVVKIMAIDDFYEYKDFSSQIKVRKITPRCYLKNVVCIKAQRGNFFLEYSSNEQIQTILDFLPLKIAKTCKFPEINNKKSLKGITKSRKENILKKLVPLMPENRRTFWINLPTNNDEDYNGDEDSLFVD